MKILLHVCCVTCLAGVVPQLSKTPSEALEQTCYFYNPNIHPKEEYLKRLSEVKKYCEKFGISLIEGSYDKERWFDLIQGLENEPEGGQRCIKCYTMRLEQTAIYGSRGSSQSLSEVKNLTSRFDAFTSTLTISPHKKAEIINSIGQKIGDKYGIKFFEADFKKHGGFKRACEIAKTEGFYRQNYCGCVYSMRHDSHNMIHINEGK